MKTIVLGILTLLSIIGTWVFGIWAVVGFIIYLAKDVPFNWWSVSLFIISVLLAVFFYIFSAIIEEKQNYNVMKKFKSKNKNSKWQAKLDEMQEQRKTK